MRYAPNYKEALRKDFSRCAHSYDKYANIQHLAAGELLKELPAKGIRNILEIGCGTGNYTFLLKHKFKAAKITAVDISREMIAVARQKFGAAKIDTFGGVQTPPFRAEKEYAASFALLRTFEGHRDEVEVLSINPETNSGLQTGDSRRVDFVVADAEGMSIADRFDLITANAAFQWFEDIEECMARYKNTLTNNGLLAFSIFGPLTFRELNESLKQALHEEIRISASYFLTEEELKKILVRHFRRISIRELLIKEEYPSLEELLNKIKYTGVQGNGANSRYFLGRGLLRKIEEIYNLSYGRIEATYQILFCKAIG